MAMTLMDPAAAAFGLLWQAVTFTPGGVPVAGLVALACGGVLYVAMSRSEASRRHAPPVSKPTPWLACPLASSQWRRPPARRLGRWLPISAWHGQTQRARGGAPRRHVRRTRQRQDERAAAAHRGLGWRGARSSHRPEGWPTLADTVRAYGGLVWTVDGTLPVDLLDSRPWQVPDLLLEAEDDSPEARAYRDAPHQRALGAAFALALRGEPMDLARLRALLDRQQLLAALEPPEGCDWRVSEWIARLRHQHGGIEDSGARGLDRALGTLLDGPALRGSLTGLEAVRLKDVLDTRGLILFRLDAAEYPHATRKVAAWVLLAMGRLARELPPFPDGRVESPRALLLVDEVGALGSAARHLRGLVGRARESGLSVVLATQGPSDLVAIDPALLPQVLQDTGWQLAFRQGSPEDAERMQALFGTRWVEDIAWRNDGSSTRRKLERPSVAIAEWMNGLGPGDAWLRVAPIDRAGRQQRLRVALPRRIERPASDSDSKARPPDRHYPSVTGPRSVPGGWALPAESERGRYGLPVAPPKPARGAEADGERCPGKGPASCRLEAARTGAVLGLDGHHDP